MICLKIRTFVVSATTAKRSQQILGLLWFAWKFVPLWYQQQPANIGRKKEICCDLLENSYLCGISNNRSVEFYFFTLLWFAWKFVPLWYQQQQQSAKESTKESCDLLENSYLCGISNNGTQAYKVGMSVVICLKIRTFVVSATTASALCVWAESCDLLENSYLCGISNNTEHPNITFVPVVICLKIRTFVVSATTWPVRLRR